ncbi:hypothetical protein [Nannocystis punicea]|uniref:Outer membrane protein beta-barrel domain-containing protein n=1 Tax=Nannocystis punicea TaxID=2995304 RepID=A0ABY7H762_9BACT|nr:hypothetical protein [Nannocystis poenicansa]WAS95113.1 hypothetical protein O0S08_03040 [Nannocystis poenicansa]
MSLSTGLFGQLQAPPADAGVAVPPPAAPAPADEAAPATAPLDATADPSAAPLPAPAPAPVYQDMSAPPAYPPAPAPTHKSRFVFAFLPGPTYGLHFFPSGNLPFFFGARLKHSPWALGFQFTLSVGFAERYWSGLLTHRYHITALTSFGARGRGFASVGGGFAVRFFSPMVEAEGRVGLRFGSRRRGIVAGVVRLGYDFAHREGAPVPQVGVVVGVCTF